MTVNTMIAHTYSTTQDPQDGTPECETHTLALLVSGGPCHIDAEGLGTGLATLGTPNLHYERWTLDEPISATGTEDRCYWRQSDHLMLVATHLSDDECQQMAAHAEQAYRRFMGRAIAHGYPTLVRCWHYLPNINAGAGDREVYKQFCLGRHQAFEHYSVASGQYPAASVLGHHDKGAIIYGFFSREPVTHIENPRQASAYTYPRQYGPQSPSFARATLYRDCLMISGTASIVGSDTIGLGDIRTQLDTTVNNINQLLAQVPGSRLQSVRVYVRHAADYAYVQAQVRARWPDVDTVYNQADICRQALLVEMEAVAYVQPAG